MKRDAHSRAKTIALYLRLDEMISLERLPLSHRSFIYRCVRTERESGKILFCFFHLYLHGKDYFFCARFICGHWHLYSARGLPFVVVIHVLHIPQLMRGFTGSFHIATSFFNGFLNVTLLESLEPIKKKNN